MDKVRAQLKFGIEVQNFNTFCACWWFDKLFMHLFILENIITVFSHSLFSIKCLSGSVSPFECILSQSLALRGSLAIFSICCAHPNTTETQPLTILECCQDGRNRAVGGQDCAILPLISSSHTCR